LTFDERDERDFGFLDNLPSELFSLSLSATTGRDVDLGHLTRYQHLRGLSIDGCKRHIGSLEELRELESLILRGVTPGDLGFVKPLKNLQMLYIDGGALRDFSALEGNTSVRNFTLGRVTGLDDLSFVGRMPGLEWFFAYWMRNVKSLPDFSGSPRLETLVFETMNGLVDFAGLSTAPVLRVFLDIAAPTGLDVAATMASVLAVPTLETCLIGFGSKKKNAMAQAAVEAQGLKWEYVAPTLRAGDWFA